ncbi:MAG: hypothetical protein ACI906_003329 [Candidatus Latescibacterota bacterium]|jgi:hypothetical protein
MSRANSDELPGPVHIALIGIDLTFEHIGHLDDLTAFARLVDRLADGLAAQPFFDIDLHRSPRAQRIDKIPPLQCDTPVMP